MAPDCKPQKLTWANVHKGIVHRLLGSPQNQLKGYRTKFRKLEKVKESQKVGITVMLQEESEENTVACATATGHSPASQLNVLLT